MSVGLRILRYLSFEIGDKCQYTKMHPKCPRNANNRFINSTSSFPITVADMIGFAKHCIDNGFNGLINFHYYNEPLMDRDTLLAFMDGVPKGKFSLWTNGILLEENYDILHRFVDVMVTLYPDNNLCPDMIKREFSNVRFQNASLDDRIIEEVACQFDYTHTKCYRPNWELIIDYYGNGHICCGDWRAEIRIGNIKVDTYTKFIENWNLLRSRLSQQWDENSYNDIPTICKRCLSRTPDMCNPGEG